MPKAALSPRSPRRPPTAPLTPNITTTYTNSATSGLRTREATKDRSAAARPIIYQYDQDTGWLEIVTIGQSPGVGLVETRDYDLGRLLTEESTPSSGTASVVEATWDLAGNRMGREVTIGTEALEDRTSYDDLGRVVTTEALLDTWVPIVTNTYDTEARLSRQRRADGSYVVYDWNSIGGTLEHATSVSEGMLRRSDLTWRPDGRVESEKMTSQGVVVDDIDYDYDAAGQMTHAINAVSNAGSRTSGTWCHDRHGNITRVLGDDELTLATNGCTYSPTGSVPLVYSHNDADKITEVDTGTAGPWEVAHDNAGRMTAVEQGEEESWSYDPAGHTTGHTRGGIDTAVTVDGLGRPVVVADNSRNGSDPLRSTRIVNDPNGHGDAAVAVDADGDVRWRRIADLTITADGQIQQTDWQGSSTDASPVDQWGTPGDVTEPASIGYRGELRLDGDLTWLRARTYHNRLNRFTTPDPLDGVDGTTTVANPYHYAGNDPLNKQDPSGLRVCDDGFKVSTDAGLDYDTATTYFPDRKPVGWHLSASVSERTEFALGRINTCGRNLNAVGGCFSEGHTALLGRSDGSIGCGVWQYGPDCSTARFAPACEAKDNVLDVIIATANSPLTVAGVVYAGAGGGHCDLAQHLQVVCTDQSAWQTGSGGAMTLGNTALWDDPGVIDEAFLAHEYVHSQQYAVFGGGISPLFFLAYGTESVLTGFAECENRFEQHAGLIEGDYLHC